MVEFDVGVEGFELLAEFVDCEGGFLVSDV